MVAAEHSGRYTLTFFLSGWLLSFDKFVIMSGIVASVESYITWLA